MQSLVAKNLEWGILTPTKRATVMTSLLNKQADMPVRDEFIYLSVEFVLNSSWSGKIIAESDILA